MAPILKGAADAYRWLCSFESERVEPRACSTAQNDREDLRHVHLLFWRRGDGPLSWCLLNLQRGRERTGLEHAIWPPRVKLSSIVGSLMVRYINSLLLCEQEMDPVRWRGRRGVRTRVSMGRSARMAETSRVELLVRAGEGLGQTLALRAKLSRLSPAEERLFSPLKPDGRASWLKRAGRLATVQ